MHDHDPCNHDHRDPGVSEEPLDAANQSLADALRSSFSILKGIMFIIVVLYLFSGVQSIKGHEQALVLRMGRLLPEVHEAGLVWALPFPIDQILVFPTRKSNEVTVASHTFFRRENEVGQPLSYISRSAERGLDPSLDGALLTADSGLVHVQWKVAYKIGDVGSYVSQMRGDRVEAAEGLIRTMVETSGVAIAAELTAEEMIRTRVESVQSEMKRRVNQRLSQLASGIVVERIDMFEPTPPIAVRRVFDDTQKAENAKQRRIRDAQQEHIKILSDVAGAAHSRVVRLLDRIQAGGTADQSVEALRAELDLVLLTEVAGEAGEQIKKASAYHSIVVGRMQSDVDDYRAHLPEFRRAPHLLVNRLWEQTRREILEGEGVTKIYRPHGVSQFRLKISQDPEESRINEQRRIQEKEFDVKKLRPETYHPIGPEYD
jgi:regulator of protease activity HflC (stomatin/prohibitin superfamily)